MKYTGRFIAPCPHLDLPPTSPLHHQKKRAEQLKTADAALDYAGQSIGYLRRTTFASATAVAEQVRAAFEAATLPATFNGVKCQTIELDSEVQLTDDEAGFAGVYQVSQDFIINYTR